MKSNFNYWSKVRLSLPQESRSPRTQKCDEPIVTLAFDDATQQVRYTLTFGSALNTVPPRDSKSIPRPDRSSLETLFHCLCYFICVCDYEYSRRSAASG